MKDLLRIADLSSADLMHLLLLSEQVREDPHGQPDLLGGDSKALGHLGTVMADGSVQVTPVWFDYDGTHLRVTSARGRIMDRKVRRDARVALSIGA